MKQPVHVITGADMLDWKRGDVNKIVVKTI